MMIQTASFLRRPFRFLDQCARTYGEPFSVHLGFTGKKRGVVVSSAKLIREVLTAPPGLLSGAKGNEALRPILRKSLKPGARIVSHRFRMGDWKPDQTKTINARDNYGSFQEYKLHLWTIK